MLFAAIFVPNFIFQAMVRNEPELRMHAIAVIDGQPPTEYVIAVNRLAENAGAQLGVSKATAEQFPQIQIRKRNRTQEEDAHSALRDGAWSISSSVEDVAEDTVLLDLDGLTRLFGTAEQIAQAALERICDLGLDANVAVSTNVQTARIIARALPGVTVVPDGQERRYLETLPVSMLSPSPQLTDIFERWGITTCKSLASLPVLSLSECVGQEGVYLHTLASGKGHRPIVPAQDSERFEERIELEEAVDNLEPLSFLMGRLLQQLCTRISSRALAIGCIHVAFNLEKAFDASLEPGDQGTTQRNPFSKTFSSTLKLPVAVQDPLLLLKLLRLRLQSNPPGAPVQAIHMIAEPARSRATQAGLFIPASPDPQKLELTVARIAAIVGSGNVGSPQLLDTERPDAFLMQSFAAPPVTPQIHEITSEDRTGFRVFRPPLTAWVQLQGNSPTRIAFQGKFGEVVRASGPWRTSGDWWSEKPWQEDIWDLEIQFASETHRGKGLYRVFHDSRQEKWWVRGVYD